MLEAMLHGHDCLGADSNPLARLITKVKLTPLSEGEIQKGLIEILRGMPDAPITDFPACPIDIEYWFYPHVVNKLHRLHDSIIIASISEDLRDFFLVCFSSCVRKVSLADPRLSVPVRLSYKKYSEGHVLRENAKKRLQHLRRIDVFGLFEKTCSHNAKRVADLYAHAELGDFLSLSSDARVLRKNNRRVRKDSVDLVLTSPPYAGAQKYIRSSGLNLAWLKMLPATKLAELKRYSIGREDYRKEDYSSLLKTDILKADTMLKTIYEKYPLRAHIAAIVVWMRAGLSSGGKISTQIHP